MKISRVRLNVLEGVFEHPVPFWEERLIRPIDIYPEHKTEGANYTPTIGDGKHRIEAAFVEVDSDNGATGIGGPITREQGVIIGRQMAALVVGEDPWAT